MTPIKASDVTDKPHGLIGVIALLNRCNQKKFSCKEWYAL